MASSFIIYNSSFRSMLLFSVSLLFLLPQHPSCHAYNLYYYYLLLPLDRILLVVGSLQIDQRQTERGFDK